MIIFHVLIPFSAQNKEGAWDTDVYMLTVLLLKKLVINEILIHRQLSLVKVRWKWSIDFNSILCERTNFFCVPVFFVIWGSWSQRRLEDEFQTCPSSLSIAINLRCTLCTCMSVCVWHMYIYVHMYTWALCIGWRLTSNVFLHCFALNLLRQGFSWNAEIVGPDRSR